MPSLEQVTTGADPEDISQEEKQMPLYTPIPTIPQSDPFLLQVTALQETL